MATFGNAGNGQDCVELRRALRGIGNSLHAFSLPTSHAIVRLDGHDGTNAVLLDLADVGSVRVAKTLASWISPRSRPGFRCLPITSSPNQRAGSCAPFSLARITLWTRAARNGPAW